MTYLPHRFSLLVVSCVLAATVLFSSNTVADASQAPVDKVLQELEAEEYSPYADFDLADSDDFDDDDLPINVIEQMYGDGRMAFLFGQYEIAFNAWGPLAKEGYAKAQAALAWMYHTGNGVSKDEKLAVEWYLKAAKQGHAIAQNNLAAMYENGRGTRVNNKAAAAWFRESADSGYSIAQYNIGRMYAEGLGLKQDIDEAIYWWRIAARQGVKEAIEELTLLNNQPIIATTKDKAPSVAHAPYHGNPVAKGLAWIEQQNNRHYTIQLARSKDVDWLLKLAASEQLNQPMVQFKTKDSKGEEWHNLIYGTFPDFQRAEKARKVLPSSFQKWSPKLRRFDEINKILLK